MNLFEEYKSKVNTKSDINEHLSTLLTYGEECDFITEMGVRTGRSTLSWLMAKPKKLVCYDILKNKNFDLPQYQKWADEQNIQFSFIIGDTRKITIEETDLLFIDTLHTYDQLRVELKLHSHKVKKYIILHDTNTFGINGEIKGTKGLSGAVNEFISLNIWRVKQTFLNNNGLTVLEKTI